MRATTSLTTPEGSSDPNITAGSVEVETTSPNASGLHPLAPPLPNNNNKCVCVCVRAIYCCQDKRVSTASPETKQCTVGLNSVTDVESALPVKDLLVDPEGKNVYCTRMYGIVSNVKESFSPTNRFPGVLEQTGPQEPRYLVVRPWGPWL